MKQQSVMSAAILSAAVLLVLIAASCREKEGEILSLTYADINGKVAGNFTPQKVDEYSRQLSGGRVRWGGRVLSVDPSGNRVYVSVDQSPSANVELDAPNNTEPLRVDQQVTFTGTIEQLSIKETFPPMPNIYVRLKRVQLETDSKK